MCKLNISNVFLLKKIMSFLNKIKIFIFEKKSLKYESIYYFNYFKLQKIISQQRFTRLRQKKRHFVRKNFLNKIVFFNFEIYYFSYTVSFHLCKSNILSFFFIF